MLLEFLTRSFLGFAVLFTGGVLLAKLRPALFDGLLGKTASFNIRIEFVSRVVSTFHAVIISLCAILCVLEGFGKLDETQRYFHDNHKKVWGNSPVADATSSMFLGYLLYDILAVLCFKAIREVATIAHHAIFIFVTTICTGHEPAFLKFPFVWLILAELSTSFVNFRWFLAVTNRKESASYRVNGYALLLTFLSTRVFLYAWGLWDIFQNLWPEIERGTEDEPWLRMMPYLLIPGFALNLFWSVKLIQGAAKVLTKRKSL